MPSTISKPTGKIMRPAASAPKPAKRTTKTVAHRETEANRVRKMLVEEYGAKPLSNLRLAGLGV